MQELAEGIRNADLVIKILQIFGISLAASVGLAYFLFRTFSAKWLEEKFQERLESFKHAQQKELEELRLKINTLFDRTVKLHQREFEVLPEAWAKLNDAYWQSLPFLSAFQQYPDLARMSPQQFLDFVHESKLDHWMKEELKHKVGQDRNSYYIENIYWIRLQDVVTKVREAHVFILKNGIFLPEPIRTKFLSLSDMIWFAVHENQFNKQHQIRPEKRDKQQEFQDKGEELLKNLEKEVSERLWSTAKVTSIEVSS